jgi:hypothetical protein
MAITDAEFAAANARGRRLRQATPGAIEAHYDRERQQVVIQLQGGLELAFAPHDVQGLETAGPEDLAEIEISPSGLGLHFPKLDADLYLPALLAKVLGSKAWAAAQLGQAGGQARTAAKQEAARSNGRLGGRPKQAAASPEAETGVEEAGQRQGDSIRGLSRPAVPKQQRRA